MPLANFGAVLNFAETIEQADMEFYNQASSSPATETIRPLFEMFIRETQKNISLIQRTRRENVTEMILEPIRDFVRDSYAIAVADAHAMDTATLLETACSLENRAIRYYTDAAQKIRALPEVSRTLNALAKKRTHRLGQLHALSIE